jgi:solute:Na+ symporter, SSS family
VIVAIVAEDVIDALSIFYTLMSVGLFVPILAGLFARRPSRAGALAAIVCGVGIVGGLQLFHGGAGIAGFTPAMLGLIAALAAYVVGAMLSRR